MQSIFNSAPHVLLTLSSVKPHAGRDLFEPIASITDFSDYARYRRACVKRRYDLEPVDMLPSMRKSLYAADPSSIKLTYQTSRLRVFVPRLRPSLYMTIPSLSQHKNVLHQSSVC